LVAQTAKVETAFLPIQPGATYKFLVDYYLDGTGTKMWAETCVVDPRPDSVREEEESKGKRTTIFRFKPFKGLPALLMVHRAAAPELGKDEPQNWYTAEREFTIPAEWPVTLPFTIRGDGVGTTFPVKGEHKDDEATFEVVEVRLRTADQKLPYRQNKGQDYTISGGSIAFKGYYPPYDATLVTNLSQFQIQLIFGCGGIPITPQSGVKVYKVLYETVDAQGLRTQASGSLCLPDNRHIPESLVQPGLAICCLLRGPTHRDLLENSRLSANLQAQSEAERRRRSG
jgi:hypothetical protein